MGLLHGNSKIRENALYFFNRHGSLGFRRHRKNSIDDGSKRPGHCRHILILHGPKNKMNAGKSEPLKRIDKILHRIRIVRNIGYHEGLFLKNGTSSKNARKALNSAQTGTYSRFGNLHSASLRSDADRL